MNLKYKRLSLFNRGIVSSMFRGIILFVLKSSLKLPEEHAKKKKKLNKTLVQRMNPNEDVHIKEKYVINKSMAHIPPPFPAL